MFHVTFLAKDTEAEDCSGIIQTEPTLTENLPVDDDVWKAGVMPSNAQGKVFSRYLMIRNPFKGQYYAKCIRTGCLSRAILARNHPYRRVSLLDDEGKRFSSSLASWLLCTFAGPPPSSKHSADHIDRNSLNDSFENLRWLDKRGQALNRSYTGKVGHMCGVIAERDGEIVEFSSVTDAANTLKCTLGNVGSVLTGRRKTTNGWKFQYKVMSDENKNEEWKKLSAKSKRELSSEGRVRKRVANGYVEIHVTTKKLYLCLNVDGVQTELHILVARYFLNYDEIRKTDPTAEVNHINGNTRDVLEHAGITRNKQVKWTHRETGIVQIMKSQNAAAHILGCSSSRMCHYVQKKARHSTYDVETVTKAVKTEI